MCSGDRRAVYWFMEGCMQLAGHEYVNRSMDTFCRVYVGRAGFVHAARRLWLEGLVMHYFCVCLGAFLEMESNVYLCVMLDSELISIAAQTAMHTTDITLQSHRTQMQMPSHHISA